MEDYINTLTIAFEKNANVKNAVGQKAYMRNQFEFFGMTSPIRKEVQKPWLIKANLPNKTKLENIVQTLWLKPQREFQFFAQDLTFKYVKQFEIKDIALIEFMITHKSWWDTVDYIAANLLGTYFKLYPEQRAINVKKWLASGNFWLQRSAILFQLKYKDQVDTKMLSHVINSLLGSKEFFINKAIGWMLREYGKTNPTWVVNFVKDHQLEKLSKKEALRLIK
ncbi:MAG: DNA alkylation repair protein [Aureibaculum sp.]|nr:DNA alkylation repair protein [Aureibaculum sp.]